jgi:DNA-directed RNA polymerase sigma subunit (sigma70/sigma32)
MLNSKLQKAQNYLQYSLQRLPTDEELSKYLNIKMEDIRLIRRESKIKVESDSFLTGDQNSDVRGSGSAPSSYFDVGQKLSSKQTSSDLLWKVEFNSALDCLTPTERRTISIRFGLLDGQPRDVKTTASLMVETETNTRDTISRALEKLRSSKSDMLLDGLQGDLLVDSTSGSASSMKYVHAY